jgi:hypothetical protein
MLEEHRVRLWLRQQDRYVYLMQTAVKLHPGLAWIEANYAQNAGVKKSGPWFFMEMAVWEAMYGNGWATTTRRKIDAGEIENKLPTGEGEDYGINDTKPDLAPASPEELSDADLGSGLLGSIFGGD